MSQTLVRYDEMCRAIAACHAIDEVKDIRDRARAIEEYARMAQNTDAEEKARAVRLRAERRVGQMLAQMERHPGRRSDITSSPDGERSFAEELEHNRISPKQAENWQKLGAVPEDIFDQALREPHPSTASIIMRHVVAECGSEPSHRPGNTKALWLWGRLQDFERQGLLDEEPPSMLEDITDHMRVTILEMAPRVAAWLKGIGK